ncbi:hypothetical protein A9G39_10015 [Gilliamella sp. Imp1-6]|nr:hypothetical protein A9G39_10015 [Gilliamella apicola]
MYKNLSKKYKLIAEKRPFVGNQYAKYTYDQTFIVLSAPHMSFESTLEYISKEFDKKVKEMSTQEKEQKNNKELNSL